VTYTYLLLSPWILWIIFAAVMRLKQVRDAGKLTPAMKVFGYPALALGLVVDFVVNVIFGTLVFLQPPREMTLSSRLWKLSNGDEGWRKDWATWIRVQLLDSLDPAGIHKG